MNTQFFHHRKWMLILTGFLIGLGVAAGFNWTQCSTAQQANTGNEQVIQQNPDVDLSVAEQLSNAFSGVAQQVNPSVVTVFTETTIKAQQFGIQQFPFKQFFGNDDFFKRFYQQPAPQGDMKQMGLGSGVIISADGIILTNNHVVDDADNIKVRLMDGREFEAKVKGKDSQTDLAVITIESENLKPIKIGNSDNVRVGEFVLAIGSPLNPQLEHTVTSGIISAKGRSGVGLSQYEDFIQTDAAINPGNSGGPLVNLKGELIGINSAIATRNGGFMGIGFAIPVNLANKVMQDIVETGKVTRGWLGVYIQNISPELVKALNLTTSKGVIVSKVQPDSPAEKAGLKEEDVIVELNGKPVDNTISLSTWVAGQSPGDEVALKIIRDEDEMSIKVELGELDTKVQQLAQGESNYEKIGIQVAQITSELANKYRLQGIEKGVVITGVERNSIAARSGLREGDAILKLDRKEIETLDDLDNIMVKIDKGDNILIYLRRGSANLFMAFTMPDEK